jgi:hypothetical protein
LGEAVLLVNAMVSEHADAQDLTDVRLLQSAGGFEDALELATRRSVEWIRRGRDGAASSALVLAAETLCTLNQPLRALLLALEALELAGRGRRRRAPTARGSGCRRCPSPTWRDR